MPSEPNSSNQCLIPCPECDEDKSSKLYVDADSGVFFCQRCSFAGNFDKFQSYFTPPDPNEEVYEKFHELSVRNLLHNPDKLEYLLDRGFTEESIARFRYGYADDYLYEKMKKAFGKARLVESKLWLLNEEKGYDFPYFSERIIIPYMRAGRYITLQGRDATDKAKKRYIFLSKKDPCIYHGEDLYKRGRVYLTEGAFKRDRLAQEGANAAALPGANNYKKFLPELRQCEDLWIVLDSDANEAGQNAALEIAKSLRACTIVTLPLMPGQDKIGVDDFLEEYGYEAFGNIPSVRYESGIEQKATSLSILVSAWKTKVESYQGKGGLDTGYPRFDSMLEGVHEGSLVFVAGAPHHAKTSLIEDMAVRLYHRHPDLEVSYYSNDDSLFTTLTRWVAKLGRLQQKDCRYPMVAFANDAVALARFEAAAARLSRMSDRLTILDRSYNISLEKLKAELVSWRKENPKAQRVIFIDAFTKTKTDRDTDIRDEMNLAIYKSSLLKEMAQQAHVPIICTHEVPKLGGRRPNSWNLKSSATLEYDADVILLCFQEAHVKGINHTSLKIEYDSGEVNPVLEVIIAKDKMCGTPRTTDLFEIQKANSRFVELDDSDYFSLLQRVRESERNEWKN